MRIVEQSGLELLEVVHPAERRLEASDLGRILTGPGQQVAQPPESPAQVVESLTLSSDIVASGIESGAASSDGCAHPDEFALDAVDRDRFQPGEGSRETAGARGLELGSEACTGRCVLLREPLDDFEREAALDHDLEVAHLGGSFAEPAQVLAERTAIGEVQEDQKTPAGHSQLVDALAVLAVPRPAEMFDQVFDSGLRIDHVRSR